MDNIAPGTLCLIIRGPNAGKTCTVKGYVPALQVQNEITNLMKRIARVKELPENPVLEIDVPVKWVCKVSGAPCGELPYIRQRSLLPIPPLEDKITTKEEEKPCQV